MLLTFQGTDSHMPCPVCGHIVARRSRKCMNCGNNDFAVPTGEIVSWTKECISCRGTGIEIQSGYTSNTFWGTTSYSREIPCSVCKGKKTYSGSYPVTRDTRD